MINELKTASKVRQLTNTCNPKIFFACVFKKIANSCLHEPSTKHEVLRNMELPMKIPRSRLVSQQTEKTF